MNNKILSKYLNWNNFQTRNADNLTAAFESMCKAIFSRKLDIKIADILEYKNQTGVECEPYLKDGKGWSFQAKFSETTKVDFLAFRKSLFKAFDLKSTGEYQNLTQIICYTNENPIRKSSVRKDIEEQALKQKITIEWSFGKRILERLEEPEYSDIRLRYFGGGQDLELYPPVGTATKSLSALKYQSKVTTFTGRSEELQSLEKFINSQKDVVWWAISGSGASGKSRLALELCDRYITQGWCCGFYDKQLNRSEIGWEPEKPHLIIVDYASQENESPIELIKKAIQLNKDNKLFFPVRILLIDRDAKVTIQAIGKTATFGEEIKSHLFDSAPLMIEPMLDTDLESIILDWTNYFELSSSESNQVRNYVINNSLDKKILTAGLLSLKIYLNGSNRENEPQSLEELIGELVDRERDNFWLPAGIDTEKEKYLILATISDGIELENSSQFRTDAKKFIEEFDFLDAYEKIVGQSVIHRLEPLSHDVVGELYVLRSFNSNLPKDKKRFQEAIQLSLQIDGGQGLVSFFTRAAYDWKKHPSLQLLLTSFGNQPYEYIPWVTLMANIIDKIDIPLLEKIQLFHPLVWNVAKRGPETYKILSHVFESFFLRLLREASQNNALNMWVRDYSVFVVDMTKMESVNKDLEAERGFNTVNITNTDLRLKENDYCDTVLTSLLTLEPVFKAGLTWPGLDEVFRHAVLHRLVDRDADIKDVKHYLINILDDFELNWPVASIFKDAVAGMIQFGHYHKKKDDVLDLIDYLIEDVKERNNKQGLESFLSVVSAAMGHAGVSYDRKIELLTLWDSYFIDTIYTDEQVGTQFVGFVVTLMHNFRDSSDLDMAIQQLERAEAVTKTFPNVQTIENLNLSFGQLIRRESKLLSEDKTDALLKKQITLIKTYGEQVPKIVSNVISNISTLYSNSIRGDFELAQKYFSVAVEVSRYFSDKDIGSEKLYLGEFLRGAFEYYLKKEDFESLCDLCDKTSELQQFKFVDVDQFLLNTPSTLFSSYQVAVNEKNNPVAKGIASCAKYWLDSLYDKKFIDSIYTHIVNDAQLL